MKNFKSLYLLGLVVAIVAATFLFAETKQQREPIKIGAAGAAIRSIMSASATLDFASAAANVCSADLTITVSTAADGDPCSVGVPNAAVNAGSSFTCWVSAANTVTVRHCNSTGAANDPASGSFRVSVTKFL